MDSYLLFLGLFDLILLCFIQGVTPATFTFVNNCDYTVWPGVLSSAGSPALETTGFELRKGAGRSFQAPTGWSGRFWGRTGCSFSGVGQGGPCSTGDCGSNGLECAGAGATPPATLAEFTLAGGGGMDFYDVSLVDGYNLPMAVTATGGSGECGATGCAADIGRHCPAELKTGSAGEGCRSACEAFGSPEYCCSGAYGSPATCRPSMYSEMFKTACPRSYSYAYDDATSTFTCSGANYQITFCPSSTSAQKLMQGSPMMTGDQLDGTPVTPAAGADKGVILGSGGDQSQEENPSILANLATAGASSGVSLTIHHTTPFIAAITVLGSMVSFTLIF